MAATEQQISSAAFDILQSTSDRNLLGIRCAKAELALSDLAGSAQALLNELTHSNSSYFAKVNSARTTLSGSVQRANALIADNAKDPSKMEWIANNVPNKVTGLYEVQTYATPGDKQATVAYANTYQLAVQIADEHNDKLGMGA